MIQKEEYLKALEIVEQYHKQLELQIVISSEKAKTKVDDWSKLYQCSKRLQNTLVGNHGFWARKKGYFKYIEDITIKDFKESYQSGKKTFDEFVELRGY